MIGAWDNSNCIFALLPMALKNGTNPAAFNTGLIPIYRGPSATGTETCTLTDMDPGYGYITTGSVKFDGVAANVATTHQPLITDASIWSWEFYFYRAEIGVWHQLVGNYTDSSHYMGVNILGPDWLALPHDTIRFVLNAGDGPIYVTSYDEVSVGRHHLVVTKNGTDVRLYLDGAEVSYKLFFAVTGTYASGVDIAIGEFVGAGSATNFNGEVDWACFYDTALTPECILKNYYYLGQNFGGIQGFSDNIGVDEVFDQLICSISDHATGRGIMRGIGTGVL